MSKDNRYRVVDKLFKRWLTCDVVWSKEAALAKAIAQCKANPGRAVRIIPLWKEVECPKK